MEELQLTSEITTEVVASSIIQTRVDEQSIITVWFNKVVQVITELRFVSKIPW